jgi:DNA-binding IclR family transcriptional regulator
MTEPTEPTPPSVPGNAKDPSAGVMAALRKIGRPALPEEVAAATGLNEASVRRTLGRLVAMKDARRAGGGRFTVSKHAP